jgi:TPR repeat protein
MVISARCRQTGKVGFSRGDRLKSDERYTFVILRPGTISSLLPMLVFCPSLVSAQTKTVSQLVVDVNRGDKASLQSLITLGTSGDAEAQATLGMLYEQGNGVTRDYAQALSWYKKAADQGDSEGEIGLAGMYIDGHGVPKDVVQAANWFRKAAEQGYPKGQYNLGVLFSNGDGVPKDHVEAANWYKKAADQGLAISQYALAWMYANGDGVPNDNIQAFVWWDLAAAQGFSGAKEHRSAIEKMMTHAEIAEARKLSRERKPNRQNQ